MPRLMRSARALLASETTAMRAPGATGGGFRIRSGKEHLSRGNQCRRTDQDHLCARACPFHLLGTTGGVHGKGRPGTAMRDGRRCAGTGSGAGGGGGANAALEDANLDFVGADHADKFDVGLLGKLWVEAKLAAEFLPAARVRAEILVVHDDDKVRVAHGDLNPVHDGLVREGYLGLVDVWDSHAGRDPIRIAISANDS